MARLSLRDRLLTPRVARAMTSPSAILLAGAGASVAIVVGAPLLAIPAALLAWGARVATAVPRQPSADRVDPERLDEPWRRYVIEALSARTRLGEAVRSTEEGPLRDRLTQIAARMESGVDEVQRIARRGQLLADARRSVDADDIRRQLAEVEADAEQPWASGSSLQKTTQSLQAQLQSVERLDRVIADAKSRLRLLDARLDEAVVRTIELSVQAADPTELGSLGADVDGLVTEMEALRQALEETGGGALAPGSG